MAQPSPGRIVAPIRHLANRLAQAPTEGAPGAHRPGHVEKDDGIRAFETEIECFVVVAVDDPRVAGKQAALRLAPLAF